MPSHPLVLTREESRALDRLAIEELGMLSIVLMENAGRSVVDYMRTQHLQGSVLICCGKGNNGGDGFVIARHLNNHRIPVRVLLCAKPEELQGDAKTNFNIIVKSGLSIVDLSKVSVLNKSVRTLMANAEWIVDALFGTGLRGSVGTPFKTIIKEINHAAAPVLAVDIPSGIDCDTGQPLGIAVRAQHTVTFVAMKKGFTYPAAKEFLGQVHVADIGVPISLLQKFK